MRNGILNGVFIFLLTAGSAFAAGDVTVGKTKAAACAACHGSDGNSVGGTFPKLAQQNEKYLVNQLIEFKKGKTGKRFNETMTPMASGLSDSDMQNIAAYYTSQTRTVGSTDPKLLAKGQELYRGGNLAKGIPACSACHGPQGQGNPEAGFPALSGQHAGYVVTQLNDYGSGKRKSVADIMTDIANKMNAEEIQAVASYVEGLH